MGGKHNSCEMLKTFLQDPREFSPGLNFSVVKIKFSFTAAVSEFQLCAFVVIALYAHAALSLHDGVEWIVKVSRCRRRRKFSRDLKFFLCSHSFISSLDCFGRAGNLS